MKSEKDIINQIRGLKDIKPDQDWVALAKCRIIGTAEVSQQKSIVSVLSGLVFQYRVAVAAMLLFFAAGNTIVATQNSLPGEPLYAVKIAAEQGMAIVTGQKDNPTANLQLAAKRLEEINLMAQRNLAQNLSAAFYDYKTAKVAAKKEVAALVKQNPAKAGEIIKEAGLAMQNVDNKEKTVYGVLGLDESANTDSGDELASDQVIAESLINYFKRNTTLSEDQLFDLDQVKTFYAIGNYSRAVEYYLNSSLNK